MKSYEEFKSFITERFDPFKVFKHKDRTNGLQADDEYDIRALVRYTLVLPSGTKTIVNAMFPPVQLKTTDNKYEFNRYLNAYIADLKSGGHEIVAIHYKGSPEYARLTPQPRQGTWDKAASMQAANLAASKVQ
jgi:hypothetical protein